MVRPFLLNAKKKFYIYRVERSRVVQHILIPPQTFVCCRVGYDNSAKAAFNKIRCVSMKQTDTSFPYQRAETVLMLNFMERSPNKPPLGTLEAYNCR